MRGLGIALKPRNVAFVGWALESVSGQGGGLGNPAPPRSTGQVGRVAKGGVRAFG